MATEIYLLKVGMTMTEGMVEEWYVADGAQVTAGDLLYRLETEKINLDVDADVSGTVVHGVAVGVTKEPGDVIGYIYAAGETIPRDSGTAPGPGAAAPAAVTQAAPATAAMTHAAAPAAASPGADGRVLSSPGARRLAAEAKVDIATLHGTGPGGRVVEADVRAAGLTAAPAAGAAAGPASPLAKRIAAELGVNLATVQGSGPGGRVTREDVEQAAARPSAVAPLATAVQRQAGSAAVAAPAGVVAAPLEGAKIPLKGMRKTIATRMFDSLHGSAQLTMDMDVAMDEAMKLRNQLLSEWAADGIRPTYTDLVVRAAAKALRAHPLMNSVFGATEITLLPDIHVGIAVAVDAGLMVPVVRDADQLDVRKLAQRSATLAAAARAGTLALDDMAGGTFTVSALGMFGVDSFTPILNAPQAGILGVNRIRDDVGWDGERPVRRKVMRLSLTWDHRILDGAPAAQFLGAVRDLLEAPYRLLI